MNWQPIETAPKDGTEILLVWDWVTDISKGRGIIMSKWHCSTHMFSAIDHDCRRNPKPECKVGWGYWGGSFSYWMPLPELPK